ncbi:Phage-base-V domain-containing protein [Sulfidibacter corallicola]|uniref:Gp5/Type VI secretion system Vgr protein OB-fold domain-containing protein n=1 Tax=Sulfidibacter corallicola TaxID=2818388 RepID=A0A8A4U629_SULCO|nr:phage baseplate assembly protein V [Sulfidibacter corallicola]QTD54205.1 hypothetical protein J3U87_17300 [Sulfidibacter corallicola]
MIATEDKQHVERYRDRWFGKYRAIARDNNDPERLGRLRLEIPAVLGTGRENWSDWASPCFAYGGLDDVGTFLVPEEGASVWAEFEGGQVQYPIWTGVWLAKSNPGEQPEEATRLCSHPTCFDCEDKLEHAPHPFDGPEHRKYHGHPPYYCPRRKVLIKTETGHTIVMDDRDQEEFLKIIDRAGQMLHMASPVKRTVQTGNARPRQTREAERGDQLDLRSDIHDQTARIQITDLSGQHLLLEARQDKEKIHLESRDRERTRWQKVLLDTTSGKEKVHIWGLNGAQEVLIDSTAGREKIQLRDKAGSTVIMDGVTGNIVVRATKKVLIG